MRMLFHLELEQRGEKDSRAWWLAWPLWSAISWDGRDARARWIRKVARVMKRRRHPSYACDAWQAVYDPPFPHDWIRRKER